jgi:hypothetical protein
MAPSSLRRPHRPNLRSWLLSQLQCLKQPNRGIRRPWEALEGFLSPDLPSMGWYTVNGWQKVITISLMYFQLPAVPPKNGIESLEEAEEGFPD